MERLLSQEHAPLFEAVLNYAKEKKISFHTPGHKHGNSIPPVFKNFVGEKIFDMDLTLLEEVDSLHDPRTVIKQAQQLAAQAYGADASFFLVNGTSGGNHAMILSSCIFGDKIIIPRNAHKSVLAGIILSGAEPLYVRPEINDDFNLICNVTPNQILKIILENPDVKAVAVTNPTYNGIATNIGEIAKICDEHKKILLVDEAHGPHLKFHDQLPFSAMEAGADMCVESTHKIISGMTQASMLHAKGKRVNLSRLKKILQLLQTTSPSYILMASLDLARMQMATEGEKLLSQTITLAEEARQEINRIPGIRCFGSEMIGLPGIFDLDPTKLTVKVSEIGLTGLEVSRILNQFYGIQPEYADLTNIIFIVSIGNKKSEIQRLVHSLREVSKYYSKEEGGKKTLPLRWPSFTTEVVMSPREAVFSETKKMPFKDAIGMVSAEIYAPYPPGIPVLVPGEKITAEIFDYLKQVRSTGTRINGQEDVKLKTIRVVEKVKATEELKKILPLIASGT